MNGQPAGIIDKVANNAWLMAVDRIAVPLIGLLVWGMYTDVNGLKRDFPVIAEKVKNLEDRANKMEQGAETARQERLGQYQTVIVEIASLKEQVSALNSTLNEHKGLLRDINNKLSARRAP